MNPTIGNLRKLLDSDDPTGRVVDGYVKALEAQLEPTQACDREFLDIQAIRHALYAAVPDDSLAERCVWLDIVPVRSPIQAVLHAAAFKTMSAEVLAAEISAARGGPTEKLMELVVEADTTLTILNDLSVTAGWMIAVTGTILAVNHSDDPDDAPIRWSESDIATADQAN